MNEKNVRVGVAVFVFRNGKFIMQQRKNAHGDGTWATPGGHLEFGETFEQTAIREVKEETGMDITHLRFGGITNDYFAEEDKHYVSVWMLSDWATGEPSIIEPDKCERQEWVDFNTLPEPLFLTFGHLLDSSFIESIKAALLQSK